jgi:hypothetical protein
MQRLVDALGHQLPSRLTRKLDAQRVADLLRAPLRAQLRLHELAQHDIGSDPSPAGTGPPLSGELVRHVGPIPARAVIAVAAQLPANRRGRTVQLDRDRPHTEPSAMQVADRQAFVFG